MTPLTGLRSGWDRVRPTGVPVFIAVLITLGLGVAFSRFAARATQRTLSRTGLSHALVHSLSGSLAGWCWPSRWSACSRRWASRPAAGWRSWRAPASRSACPCKAASATSRMACCCPIFRPVDRSDFAQAGGEQGTALEMGVLRVTLVRDDDHRFAVPHTGASSDRFKSPPAPSICCSASEARPRRRPTPNPRPGGSSTARCRARRSSSPCRSSWCTSSPGPRQRRRGRQFNPSGQAHHPQVDRSRAAAHPEHAGVVDLERAGLR